MYNVIIEVQGQIVHAVITFTEDGKVKLISCRGVE